MIIIKTKTGHRLVNDKAVTMVEHDEAKAVVNVAGVGEYYHIEEVESITIASDAQPLLWRDGVLQAGLPCNPTAQPEPKADPNQWWPDSVDVTPVSAVVQQVEKDGCHSGYGAKLEKVFAAHHISTVGDLLRIGRSAFRQYQAVGVGSIGSIDRALSDLYDIKGW